MIRKAEPRDTSALLALAAATGVFEPSEAEELLGSALRDVHAGQLGPTHTAFVWEAAELDISGWVYVSAEAHSDRAWQLWWIGVDPASQGKRVGSRLLHFVEEHVQQAGGRLLLIETSSLSTFEHTRRFYTSKGYAECGCIPDFYADGDSKVIFHKKLEESCTLICRVDNLISEPK